ncbi:MAG: hypothetical protein QNJ36_07370 [Calothrix sp. MO_167.B42]|nr:hypothetical protein [Calothrix sp. MO_167.B42]
MVTDDLKDEPKILLGLDVPIKDSQPSWMQFAGVFKDDPDFLEIMEAIQAERNSDDESEVDPSYYL